MKDKYEISLWEDYLVEAENDVPAHYEERKVCVIGSDTLTSPCRAVEPKITQNINGTNTLTFKMYYTYNDKGQEFKNPWLSLLVNERKVKALWKGEWYDFVIKDCNEDSSSKSITYTCKDLFINELSKTGFNLEFNTELENNMGTIQELGAKIIDGTDWQLGNASDIVYQETEEGVYEVIALNGFDATGLNRATGADTTVHVNMTTKLLVFYSTYVDRSPYLQFWYAPGGDYQTDGSSMLVLNGQCLGLEGGAWVESNNAWTYVKGVLEIVSIPKSTSISLNYRAKRLVRSQLQVVDPLNGKYCSVYTDNGSPETEYYSFFKTEYSDVTFVTNYITNSKNYSGTTGWVCPKLTFTLYPDYVVGYEYKAKGYLKIPRSAVAYNSGIKDFQSYISNGFTKGEKYIFRVKAMIDSGNKPSGTYCVVGTMSGRPFIGKYTYNEQTREYSKSGNSYFSYTSASMNGDWVEFEITCTTSVSQAELSEIGFFLDNTIASNSVFWVEEIQLFKKTEGKPVIQTGYDSTITYVEDDVISYNDVYYQCIRETKGNDPSNTTYWKSLGSTEPTSIRINPGNFNAQSYANEVWRLYAASQDVESEKEIVYTYSGTKSGLDNYISQNSLYPKYGPNGKFEKIRSIEGKQSNRFNLLQSLAETFEVWVKFTINHDSTGRIIYTNGKPEKFINFVNEVGGRNGLTFKYGIDLKAITRDINSDQITSKVIVPANNNQFGKHGFCTIARAKDNYPKTSFILNFDYYISQGLLSRAQIYNDLYSSDPQYIGYYYHLRILNTQLEAISEELIEKQNELDKLTAKKTVLDSQIEQTLKKITEIESDLARYAGYGCFCEKEIYDYMMGRGRNDTVVKSAWAVRLGLKHDLDTYYAQKANIDKLIINLKARIALLFAAQADLIARVEALDKKFFAKYSRFIQEGSWTSDSYYDDDLYYYDALSTAYTSSRPQLSYNIAVIRISSIEEFKNKVFNLGDISYVEDTEFFGYEQDGVTPYKEEVVISEITSNFDSPQNDEIKVQNYKTQFEDLFQRIAATTQTLQFTTGAYNNTVNNFTTTGELKSDVLQKSLEANKDLSIAGENDSVVITKEGIVVADENDPAKMVKVSAAGIFLSQDKGTTWTPVITGNGVQPQMLAVGPIATDKINITGGKYPTMKWNDYGISAYSFTEDEAESGNISSIQDKVFVRFDQFGLYGVDKSGVQDWDVDWRAYSTDEVFDNANFGFTWSGFFIKSNNNGGYVSITSDDDFQVFAAAAGSTPTERIKIGNLGTAASPQYGLRISDEDGNPVLVTDETGQLNLEGTLTVSNGTDDVIIGKQDGDLTGKVIDANGEFIVYLDGSVVARDITITGGSAIGIDINDVTLDGGSWDTV